MKKLLQMQEYHVAGIAQPFQWFEEGVAVPSDAQSMTGKFEEVLLENGAITRPAHQNMGINNGRLQLTQVSMNLLVEQQVANNIWL